jgi:hypothetical protein
MAQAAIPENKQEVRRIGECFLEERECLLIS